MRLTAYVQYLNPSTLRRIVAPFSTLASRGHQVHFTHTSDPYALETANYNLIFLPDWAWEGKLPKAQGEYVYDLSNAELLREQAVINIIQQCQHVTVPTSTIGKLVKPFCNHVVETPSLVASEVFFAQAQKRPPFPIVACLGDFEWSLIQAPLLEALQEFSDVHVVTTNPTLYAALPEKRRAFVSLEISMYPKYLRSCYLALFPGERRTVDPGMIHEFGLFGVPSIVGPAFAEDIQPHTGNHTAGPKTGMVADSPESFLAAFRKLTADDGYRARLANAARTSAREHTAVRGADAWLHTVAKFCPTVTQSPILR